MGGRGAPSCSLSARLVAVVCTLFLGVVCEDVEKVVFVGFPNEVTLVAGTPVNFSLKAVFPPTLEESIRVDIELRGSGHLPNSTCLFCETLSPCTSNIISDGCDNITVIDSQFLKLILSSSIEDDVIQTYGGNLSLVVKPASDLEGGKRFKFNPEINIAVIDNRSKL